jgi:hypothetical protein
MLKFYLECQWLTTGRWFTLGAPVSSTNKSDRHDITEILLKVALNTITLTLLELIMKSKINRYKARKTLKFKSHIFYKKWQWKNHYFHCFVRFYSHKTFEYEFCSHTWKTSNQNVTSNRYSILIGRFCTHTLKTSNQNVISNGYSILIRRFWRMSTNSSSKVLWLRPIQILLRFWSNVINIAHNIGKDNVE